VMGVEVAVGSGMQKDAAGGLCLQRISWMA